MKKYFCDICGQEARQGPHDFNYREILNGKEFYVTAIFSIEEGEAHFCEDHRREFLRNRQSEYLNKP